jgi:hypothetical protein
VLRRVLPAAALAVLIVAVAAVAGWPDLGRALDLVTGARVTAATELAFVGLLCWLGIAVMVWVIVASVLRSTRRAHALTTWWWSLAVLAVGVSLLAAGIVRHQGYGVCCANSITVQQAEQRAR